jgi:hypothetical protein
MSESKKDEVSKRIEDLEKKANRRNEIDQLKVPVENGAWR